MQKLPRTIWALGFVSMFMDVSSEMIHSLLPVFLWSVLGVNTAAIGLLEGAAEAMALFIKSFSGVLSDRVGKRKPLVFAGYALGALTKPFFALATGFGMVFGARMIDRVGKGVRGAPRDALVADVTDATNRGAAYGLRQSLDTVGAFLGPLLASGLMLAFAGNFRLVFWVATVPGVFALVIIALAIKEPPSLADRTKRPKFHYRDIRQLDRRYWQVVAFGAVFTLARFSEAFLLLRAQSVGVAAARIPLVLVLMNLVYTVVAYPAGRLSDRIGRGGLMAAGLVALLASDAMLYLAHAAPLLLLGTTLWGLHMGLTQGLLAAMVADTAPKSLRGTAFGLFSLAVGIATLAASLVAGGLWESIGPSATFLAGGGFAALALGGYLLVAWGNR